MKPRPGRSPWCVAFDLDDTLILERDYIRSGFEAVGRWAAERLGLQDFAARAWSLYRQGVEGRIFDETLAEAGHADAASCVPEMVRLYREHAPRIALPPDAERCLHWLGRSGWPLALITDGPAVSQRRKFARLRLALRFDAVAVSDDWGRAFWKPHPRAFELVESRLAGRAQRFVYVGDNPHKDFAGPRSRGWKTIRIRRPEGRHAKAANLAAAPPDCEITSLDALAAALDAFDSQPAAGARPATGHAAPQPAPPEAG